MKSKFSLKNKQGKDLEVSGLELIKIAHDICEQLWDKAKAAPSSNSASGPSSSSSSSPAAALAKSLASSGVSKPEIINAPGDWLYYARELNTEVKGHFTEMNIKFPDGSEAIQIKDGYSRNVYFRIPSSNNTATYKALSYEDIVKWIKAILGKKSIDSKELALILQERIATKSYPTKINSNPNIPPILDALLVLLFCVESSRHLPATLYGLMLLDMIAYGDPTKYNWDTVFTSGKEYQWDNHEAAGYGGKYPLSVKSTGRGNFNRFTEAMKDSANRDQTETDNIFKHRQQNAVMVRGATLMVHWLNHLGHEAKEYLEKATSKDDLMARIQTLIEIHLCKGYGLTLKKETPIINITFDSEYRATKTPMQTITPNSTLVRITHATTPSNVTVPKTPTNIYHYQAGNQPTSILCKLVPDHIKNSKVKFHSKYYGKDYQATGSADPISAQDVIVKKLVLCQWCKKHETPVATAASGNNNNNITTPAGTPATSTTPPGTPISLPGTPATSTGTPATYATSPGTPPATPASTIGLGGSPATPTAPTTTSGSSSSKSVKTVKGVKKY